MSIVISSCTRKLQNQPINNANVTFENGTALLYYEADK